MACEVAPPTISPSLIKNLGASFCDIDPAQLTEEVLTKKKKVSAPSGKKKALKKHTEDPDNENTTKNGIAKKKPKK